MEAWTHYQEMQKGIILEQQETQTQWTHKLTEMLSLQQKRNKMKKQFPILFNNNLHQLQQLNQNLNLGVVMEVEAH